MNFKGFKKVQEDDKMATMRHPSGHEVRIVKSSLRPEHQKALSELPLHQSEPESAVQTPDDNPDVNSSQPNSQAPVVNIFTAPHPAQQAAAPMSSSVAPQGQDANTVTGGSLLGSQRNKAGTDVGSYEPPQPPQPDQDPNQLAPQDTSPQPLTTHQQLMQASPMYREAATGLEMSQQAKLKADQHGVQSINAAQTEMDAKNRYFDQQLHEKMDNQNAMIKWLNENPVNANRYMENQSVGGKIATALGLILGGYGAGLTGGPNMAMDFLNKQIDRDLKSQEANIDTHQNLLAAYRHQYGDMAAARAAYLSTRYQMLGLQMDKIAQQRNMDMTGAEYHMGRSQIYGPAIENLRNLNLIDMKNKAYGGGGSEGATEQYHKALQMYGQPKDLEDFEKHYVPGVGMSEIPLEPKDREALAHLTDIKKLLPQAQDMLSKYGWKGPDRVTSAEDYGKAENIQSTLNERMGQLADLGRFTAEENKLYKQGLPSLTGFHFTARDQGRMDALTSDVNDKISTLMHQKGIKPQSKAQ